MSDFDRFDRMLVTDHVNGPGLLTRPIVTAREPVITSTRGPRFVAHATCPMCGASEVGVEYQGELMSGSKIHTIAAHTAGMRRVERGQPRCLGASMRIEFVGGAWRGLQP